MYQSNKILPKQYRLLLYYFVFYIYSHHNFFIRWFIVETVKLKAAIADIEAMQRNKIEQNKKKIDSKTK